MAHWPHVLNNTVTNKARDPQTILQKATQINNNMPLLQSFQYRL